MTKKLRDVVPINEGIRNAVKAWKLHTREERRRGNWPMHPAVQTTYAATMIAPAVAHTIHSAASGDIGGAALSALPLASTYALMADHISRTKKIYRHLQDQPKRDKALQTHREHKAKQEEYDKKFAAEKAVRDNRNARRRELRAARKPAAEVAEE